MGASSPSAASTSRANRVSAYKSFRRAVGESSLGAAVVPLASVVVSLVLVAIVVTWAQDAVVEQRSDVAIAAANRIAAAASGSVEGGAEAGGGGGGGGEEESAAVEEEAEGGKGRKKPFLSDLLPGADVPQVVGGDAKMTPEQQALARAEAVYKSNVIRRRELMGGSRPQAPYRGWTAGRIREVFLSPLYPCPGRRRIGPPKGGKMMCFPVRLKGKSKIMYSVGARGDMTFEQSVARQLHTRPFVFDPMASEPPLNEVLEAPDAQRYWQVTPIGIAAKRELATYRKEFEGKTISTLSQVMANLGHSHVDVLKLDCGGCEPRLLQELGSTFSAPAVPPSHLLVETAQTRHVGKLTAMLFAVEDAGYRLFHAQPSSSRHRGCLSCFELSFVHQSFLVPAASDANGR